MNGSIFFMGLFLLSFFFIAFYKCSFGCFELLIAV